VSGVRRVLVALGTRPEVIKLAPVVFALRRVPGLDVRVLATAQHRDLLDQALAPFGLVPDIDLDLMRDGQQLASLTARVVERVDGVLASLRPDLLVVQGDTTTVFGASLAAFYRHVGIGHVEAGLRTHDLTNPFPEEANRQLTSVLATLHFAPTARARAALLAEGVPDDRIAVTGNPVVDALQWLIEHRSVPQGAALEQALPVGSRVLLVTTHRRESWGHEMASICDALRELIARFPDVHVVLPVHPNPEVRKVVTARLEGLERAHLTPPLDYVTFVGLLRRARLVLTDSGGVLEEAVSLGRPVLVLRKHTERPEACERGLAEVVGTDPQAILASASRLLMAAPGEEGVGGSSPYGDGQAAARIATAVSRWFDGRSPLLDPDETFRPSP
jgi:UDP-N-acetylglucosamine 2-epimerase (non-hydrolysing)